MITIFVATYTDDNGTGYQKAFIKKEKAKIWLKKQWERDFDEDAGDCSFENWCEYGAWTGKIKRLMV